MNYVARQNTLREQLVSRRLDALLVTHLPNIRYLCGFTGSAGFLIVTEGGSVFFSDVRYDTQARDEVKGAKIIIPRKSVLEALAAWFGRQKKAKGWTIGIEAEHITVAAEMEYAARRAGAEEMSFPTIIASGARSALPHGRASQQAIAPGGFVVCDFGVILAGYCSDQTRTVWVGAANGSRNSEARAAYEAVKEAQLASIAAVRPGATTGEVDAAGRKVLRKAGLDRYFTHSTGHGVGLEIHEAPRVAAGQKEVLKPGMVITIEPGVYFPGKWGIRIEDMVAVREGGREVLTPTSKDFLAV
jgi:Xaa-Pro aminopeptidase